MRAAAHLAHSASQPWLQWMGTMRLRVMLDAAATGGALGLIEETAGMDDASPRHVHSREDETIVVVQGCLRVWAGQERLELAAGDSVFLPRGVPHAFRVTAADTRLLLAWTPGGHEELFRQAAWDLRRPVPPGWSVSLEELDSLAERLGAQVLGPPVVGEEAL